MEKKMKGKEKTIEAKQKKLEEAVEMADGIRETHQKALDAATSADAAKDVEMDQMRTAHTLAIEEWSQRVMSIRGEKKDEIATEVASKVAAEISEIMKEKDSAIDLSNTRLVQARSMLRDLTKKVKQLTHEATLHNEVIAQRDTLLTERSSLSEECDKLRQESEKLTIDRDGLSRSLRVSEEAETDRVDAKVSKELGPLREQHAIKESRVGVLEATVSELERTAATSATTLQERHAANAMLKENTAVLEQIHAPCKELADETSNQTKLLQEELESKEKELVELRDKLATA